MKANELMIGDWVQLQTFIGNRSYKVTDLSDNDYGEYAPIQLCCDGYCNGVIEAEPIPLTEEILKANGWISVETTFHANYKGGLHLAIKKCKNDFKLKIVKSKTNNGERDHTNSRRWRIPEIVYVHELQHALRLCGLNELADNFKLE